MRVRTGGGSPFVFWELTLLKLNDDDDAMTMTTMMMMMESQQFQRNSRRSLIPSNL